MSELVGTQAVDLLIKAVEHGKVCEVSLLNNSNGKWLGILVLPPSSDPMFEFSRMSKYEGEFKSKDVHFSIVSDKPAETIQQTLSFDVGSSNISILSDSSKALSQSLGCLEGLTLVIISPQGIIKHHSVVELSGDGDGDEIIRVISSTIQAGSMNRSPVQNTFKVLATNFEKACPMVLTAISQGVDVTINNVKSWQAMYRDSLITYPLETKAITSGIIAAIGEILGGMIKGHKNLKGRRSIVNYLKTIDIKRVAIFAAYGTCITGPIFHLWYGFLHKFVSSLKLSLPKSIALKLTLNQLVLTPPFLLLTLSYLNFAQSLSVSKTSIALKNSFAIALFTNWKIWTPAQAVNFAVVPLDYQVVYGNIVAVWWNLYLSLVS